MTNFIKTASEWISDYREEHASESVVIRWPANTQGIPTKATITDTAPESNAQGVRVQAQYTNFIVKYSVFVENKIPLDRGLLVVWDNKEFELAFDRRALWEWNDPLHVDVLLHTIFKKDNDLGLS